MLSLSYCLHTLDLFLDLDRGWGAVAELTEETEPAPHLSSELLRESAGLAESFLFFASSLSRFRFFFCLRDKALVLVPGLGDPGVEESGVLEVRESRPEVELPEHLLEPVSSSSVDPVTAETWEPATMPLDSVIQELEQPYSFHRLMTKFQTRMARPMREVLRTRSRIIMAHSRLGPWPARKRLSRDHVNCWSEQNSDDGMGYNF